MSVKTKKVTKKVAVKKKAPLPVGNLGQFPLTNGYRGWRVKRNKTNFVFECGAVRLSHKEVELFLTELKRLKSTTTEQTTAYNKVLNDLTNNKLTGGTEFLDPDTLKKFFFRRTKINK